MLINALFVVLGYLLGSISTAVIVSRLMGLPDPRTQGSNNPGATNVLRLGGKKAAALTLVGDLLKGLLPVLLARAMGLDAVGVALTALAAFLGHLYPLYFGFQGGKGVATAFGAILALSPVCALAVLLSWLATAAITRISSLAALTAAALSPLFLWWFALPGAYVAAMLVMVILLVWRHSANISRLLAGTEKRIGTR